MAPRSQLEVTTASVLRLVKEEASYHRELQEQTERIQKLEAQKDGEDENQEYLLKQEVYILLARVFLDITDWHGSTALLRKPRMSCRV